jgi:predicted membrane protein
MSTEIAELPTRRSNAGRKTNLERMEREIEERRLERKAEREARRARPLPIDTRITLSIALIIGTIVIATAFTISYATMVSVASWMKLPWEPLIYAVPGFIELLVILSTLDYIVTRSRGKSARAPLWATVALSAIAVLGNAAHTVQQWGSEFGPAHWESFIGVALSALAPLVVVYVAKRITALVFEHPDEEE